MPSSTTSSASTASCPALVTLANAPLSEQDGENLRLIWVRPQALFLKFRTKRLRPIGTTGYSQHLSFRAPAPARRISCNDREQPTGKSVARKITPVVAGIPPSLWLWRTSIADPAKHWHGR